MPRQGVACVSTVGPGIGVAGSGVGVTMSASFTGRLGARATVGTTTGVGCSDLPVPPHAAASATSAMHAAASAHVRRCLAVKNIPTL